MTGDGPQTEGVRLQPGRTILDKDRTIYDLLRFLPPGLMLDVGAAAGRMTRLMLVNSPKSEILAFEPFAGNHKFFRETIGDNPRVRLFPYAVGEHPGDGWFRSGRTVQGTEPGWEHMRGYSSLGYLVDKPEEGNSGLYSVRTVTVDEIVGSRHVRFMKVDIQGGELKLLKGASGALSEGRIDVMFLEFSGEEELLKHLLQFPVSIFDTDYMIVPKSNDERLGISLSNWDILDVAYLSTGQKRYIARPRSIPSSSSFESYIEFFESQRRNFQFIQTDLIVVRDLFLDEFHSAARKLSENR